MVGLLVIEKVGADVVLVVMIAMHYNIMLMVVFTLAIGAAKEALDLFNGVDDVIIDSDRDSFVVECH